MTAKELLERNGDFVSSPLLDPAEVAELDEELGACFLGLADTPQLKTAVYPAKRREHGVELAAKDLADVVELLKAHSGTVDPALLAGLHPVIRAEPNRIPAKLRSVPGAADSVERGHEAEVG